jgi:putative peptidoglycan lipid II flippase
MGLNVAFSLAFIGAFQAVGWMALGGLALSNSLATTLEMVVLMAIIRRRLNGLEGQRMARSLARIAVSAAAMGVVAGGLAWMLAGRSALLAGGLAVALGAVVYAGVSLLLGATEPRAVWQMVRSGSRR